MANKTERENEIKEIEKLRSVILEKLNNSNWTVESQKTFENGYMRYRLDVVIKYKDDVQVIFEFKPINKIGQFKEMIIKQCNLYRVLFPQSAPIVYVTDGQIFHEIIDGKNSDWGDGESLDRVIEKIIGRTNNSPKPNFKLFIEKLKNTNNERVVELAETIERGDTESFFEINLNTFSFTREYEKKFFKAILGDASDVFYRYTSIDSVIRILSDQRCSMASLLGMTDFTECYYADNYVKRKIRMDSKEMDKIYKAACNCFIMSCTKNEDENLKMWEDYGDKFKGVRIRYVMRDNGEKNKFWIAPVSYAKADKTHPKLDLIASIQQKFGNYSFKINEWDVWQHFFKPYDYKDEKEIRVFYLYENSKDENEMKNAPCKWINKDGIIIPLFLFENDTFPCVINEIMLGPIRNFERDRAVLNQMLLICKANGIEVTHSIYREDNKSQIYEKRIDIRHEKKKELMSKK